MKTNRKTSIELMRFLAAVMVVLIHIRQRAYPDNGLAELAFIAVDFFFMMTGFFTLLEISSKEPAGIAAEAYDAVLYALNKAKGIFGLYIFLLQSCLLSAPPRRELSYYQTFLRSFSISNGSF